MDYLTDDSLSYLTETILDNNGCSGITSFMICHRIKLISDKMVNNKLKQNYKIIIRNNNLLNPLHAYHNIYKIYKNKFILSDSKLNNFMLLLIKSNNMELLEILYKTIPKTMNSDKIETRLLNIFLECKNDNIDKTSLSEYFSELKNIIINKDIIVDLLKNYYDDIIKFKTFLKNLISSNSIYEEILKIFCIVNDDINILELILDEANIHQLIKYSRAFSSKKITTYIESNYRYIDDLNQNILVNNF